MATTTQETARSENRERLWVSETAPYIHDATSMQKLLDSLPVQIIVTLAVVVDMCLSLSQFLFDNEARVPALIVLLVLGVEVGCRLYAKGFLRFFRHLLNSVELFVVLSGLVAFVYESHLPVGTARVIRPILRGARAIRVVFQYAHQQRKLRKSARVSFEAAIRVAIKRHLQSEFVLIRSENIEVKEGNIQISKAQVAITKLDGLHLPFAIQGGIVDNIRLEFPLIGGERTHRGAHDHSSWWSLSGFCRRRREPHDPVGDQESQHGGSKDKNPQIRVAVSNALLLVGPSAPVDWGDKEVLMDSKAQLIDLIAELTVPKGLPRDPGRQPSPEFHTSKEFHPSSLGNSHRGCLRLVRRFISVVKTLFLRSASLNLLKRLLQDFEVTVSNAEVRYEDCGDLQLRSQAAAFRLGHLKLEVTDNDTSLQCSKDALSNLNHSRTRQLEKDKEIEKGVNSDSVGSPSRPTLSRKLSFSSIFSSNMMDTRKNAKKWLSIEAERVSAYMDMRSTLYTPLMMEGAVREVCDHFVLADLKERLRLACFRGVCMRRSGLNAGDVDGLAHALSKSCEERVPDAYLQHSYITLPITVYFRCQLDWYGILGRLAGRDSTITPTESVDIVSSPIRMCLDNHQLNSINLLSDYSQKWMHRDSMLQMRPEQRLQAALCLPICSETEEFRGEVAKMWWIHALHGVQIQMCSQTHNVAGVVYMRRRSAHRLEYIELLSGRMRREALRLSKARRCCSLSKEACAGFCGSFCGDHICAGLCARRKARIGRSTSAHARCQPVGQKSTQARSGDLDVMSKSFHITMDETSDFSSPTGSSPWPSREASDTSVRVLTTSPSYRHLFRIFRAAELRGSITTSAAASYDQLLCSWSASSNTLVGFLGELSADEEEERVLRRLRELQILMTLHEIIQLHMESRIVAAHREVAQNHLAHEDYEDEAPHDDTVGDTLGDQPKSSDVRHSHSMLAYRNVKAPHDDTVGDTLGDQPKSSASMLAYYSVKDKKSFAFSLRVPIIELELRLVDCWETPLFSVGQMELAANQFGQLHNRRTANAHDWWQFKAATISNLDALTAPKLITKHENSVRRPILRAWAHGIVATADVMWPTGAMKDETPNFWFETQCQAAGAVYIDAITSSELPALHVEPFTHGGKALVALLQLSRTPHCNIVADCAAGGTSCLGTARDHAATPSTSAATWPQGLAEGFAPCLEPLGPPSAPLSPTEGTRRQIFDYPPLPPAQWRGVLCIGDVDATLDTRVIERILRHVNDATGQLRSKVHSWWTAAPTGLGHLHPHACVANATALTRRSRRLEIKNEIHKAVRQFELACGLDSSSAQGVEWHLEIVLGGFHARRFDPMWVPCGWFGWGNARKRYILSEVIVPPLRPVVFRKSRPGMVRAECRWLLLPLVVEDMSVCRKPEVRKPDAICEPQGQASEKPGAVCPEDCEDPASSSCPALGAKGTPEALAACLFARGPVAYGPWGSAVPLSDTSELLGNPEGEQFFRGLVSGSAICSASEGGDDADSGRYSPKSPEMPDPEAIWRSSSIPLLRALAPLLSSFGVSVRVVDHFDKETLARSFKDPRSVFYPDIGSFGADRSSDFAVNKGIAPEAWLKGTSASSAAFASASARSHAAL